MSFNSQLSAETKKYLEEKKVPALIEHLFHELAVAMPSDPLKFLVDLLEKQPKPRVMLLGAPCSGKSTAASALAGKYQVPVINFSDCLAADAEAAAEISKISGTGARADALCAKLVAKAAEKATAESGGWILDGFPRTRSEAIGLQAAGVLPAIVVVLDADAETAQSRVTNDMDAASVMSSNRSFSLNHEELIQCYPAGSLRVHVDANASADDTVASVEAKVQDALS